jgi:ribose-phosphate pyrophosphokinase
MHEPIVILSGEHMHQLGESMSAQLTKRGVTNEHQPLHEETFPDGEVCPRALRSVRNKDVYMLLNLRWPDPNTALMRYALTVDMLRRASAGRIHAVLPYLPYMRQDRKDKGRSPISARYVAEMLEHNGDVQHIVTFDLHADQEEGFFNWSIDHLRGELLFAEYYATLLRENSTNVLVVAPDVGASKRAQRFAKRLNNAPLAIIDKRRSGPGQNEIVNFIGPESLHNMRVILFDDMCDSGGTLVKAAEMLYSRGATQVHAAVTHGLFNNNAEERLKNARISIATLGTIPRNKEYETQHEHIAILPIDTLLARVVYETTHANGSVSQLFE